MSQLQSQSGGISRIMSRTGAVPASTRLFPYERWAPQASELACRYEQNKPYPHILLEDFLEHDTAIAMAQEFPTDPTDAWTQYKHPNENTLGMSKREFFPAVLGAVTDELNSPEFVAWVSQITGIPGLMADPMMEGSGLHSSGPGGYLNVHTDFSMHHFHQRWHRRVNLILYLNPGWLEEWGGAVELWERSANRITRCVVKYPPFLNHALIFTTDRKSLHGYPDPMTCPRRESRKSLALYYYTLQGDASFSGRSTDYFARPQDGWWKSAMIWLDKKAIDLYSRAKVQFGFSDDLASRILGWWSGKK